MTDVQPARRGLLVAGALGGFGLIAAGAGRAAAEDSASSTLDAVRSSGSLKIGVAQGEPWFFKDQASGEWKGIGWGVGVALARELNVQPVPVETSWGTAIAGLQAGQFDVMFAMDATPQRALAAEFPVQPMFFYAQAVLAKDGLDAATWQALNKPDVKIGVVLGTSPDRDITVRLPQAEIQRFPNADEAGAAFASGRVDALSLFHPALVMMAKRLRRGTVLVPTPVRASASSAGVRREADKSWRDWVGHAIGYLYETGETQRIYEEFLAFRGIDPTKAPGLVPATWTRG
ncbi:transporter substrate-binding domain-containing protein [Labrys wisconsinensis]|uniref:Polar amino acid transport system substrate-binding protein n=1 Tax=Labrys wisconsinensis TaxID=425677 RepID=A0ABU0JK31_9HYPH|nr:transporter substrate-binding domain-containing protein [Labrys wisconsinensis]MDQ0474638.1 polar amino acid transport system substrate-binding protein [Labrys wisconsinensis]